VRSDLADFKPRIVAFLCNWCSYAGADLAGTTRVKHRADVRIIRVPCSGRVDISFIMKALERGADGIIVGGCHPGNCHYITGNYTTRRRMFVVRELLGFLGIEPERLQVTWCSASEGAKWAEVVEETCDIIERLGPLDRMKDLTGSLRGGERGLRPSGS
jgi:F420-non-reducing hydrogenase iron-sulfur subunit